MNEPLRQEAIEQALNDSMLEVQMDDTVIDYTRIVEDDWAKWLLTKLPRILAAFEGLAECVNRFGPCRIGSFAAGEIGKRKARAIVARTIMDSRDRVETADLQR